MPTFEDDSELVKAAKGLNVPDLKQVKKPEDVDWDGVADSIEAYRKEEDKAEKAAAQSLVAVSIGARRLWSWPKITLPKINWPKINVGGTGGNGGGLFPWPKNWPPKPIVKTWIGVIVFVLIAVLVL